MIGTVTNIRVPPAPVASVTGWLAYTRVAWKVSEADVIDRLLDMFVNQWPVATGDTAAEQQDQIPVQAVYEGVVTEGLFEVASGRLTITSGDLEGRTYRSPSGAAMAVVRHLNPNVHPNRNGWTFWTTKVSGEFIQSSGYKVPVGIRDDMDHHGHGAAAFCHVVEYRMGQDGSILR